MTDSDAPDVPDSSESRVGRRGAHRARPGIVHAALPVVLVAVLVAAVVVGVTTLLGSEPPESAATATGAPSPSGTPTASGTVAGTGTPTATSTATDAEVDPGAEVDLGADVVVLNGTRTSGLAAAVADVLSDAGWNVVRTANFRDAELPTTVFYGSTDLAATAEAVAEDLDGARTRLDGDLAEEVTVVLGPDYAGP